MLPHGHCFHLFFWHSCEGVPSAAWDSRDFVHTLFVAVAQTRRQLRAAAAHFSRAEEGRAAWAAAGKPHPALQAAAQPLPLLYRSWGQALLWAGEERAARAVFQRGVDAGFGWVTPWARPTVPLAPLGGAPRPFFDAATAPALAPTLRALEAAAPALAAEFGGLLRRRKGARAALAKEAAGLHEPGAAGGFSAWSRLRTATRALV